MHRNPYELPLISVTMALMACGLLAFTLHTFMSMIGSHPRLDAPPERVIQGKFPQIPKSLTVGTYRLKVKTRVVEQTLLGAISSTKEGVGSSFAIDLTAYGLKEKKYIITAAHCVIIAGTTPAESIEVEIRTPLAKRWIKCKPAVIDKDRDAALLVVEEELPVSFEIDTEAVVGAAVVVGGCPAGTTPSATLGFLTSKDPELGGNLKCQVWQVSVPFFYGNSGGPVIDAESSKVIGILVAGLGDGHGGLIPGVAICVPSVELKRLVSYYMELRALALQPVPVPAPIAPVIPAPAPNPPAPQPKAEIVPIPEK